MKKILINARQKEETRIAIIENNQLIDLDIESVDREQKKSNIYKAKISRIEPSLNAIFVNYGEDKNGFLPYKEISPEYFNKPNKDLDIPLNELLEVGQELIVQIVKEERGSKGAALTTFITLAGCYMVIMPNNPSAGGISRRVEGEERQKLKTLFDALDIPKGTGVIIRTAGVDRSIDEIQADLDTLVKLYAAIKQASYQHRAPFLIHKESDITIRAIRDYLKEDIQEIIIDDTKAYQDLKRQLNMLRPHFVERLQFYSKDTPLFSAHHIEKQIESAFKREVTLSSGGSIIIDTTEALTAIDINSARATKGDNIEETALATNLEAALEIAKQLRLRDLGGLIIVDFIDMGFFANQKTIEQALIEALTLDRAKIQMTRISKFGLVEISRQRLQASLGESVMLACPRCEGHGFIRSIPSLSLSVLRSIRTEVRRDKTNEIRVQLPIDVATFLLNEKRDEIKQIEQSSAVKILLIPNPNLQSPHFTIQRIWGEVYHASRPSFDLIENEVDVVIYKTPTQDKSKEPALKTITKQTSDKQQTIDKTFNHMLKNKESFWNKLIAFFFKDAAKLKTPTKEPNSRPVEKKQTPSNYSKPAKPVRKYGERQKQNKPTDRNDKTGPGPRQTRHDSRNSSNNTPRYSNRLQVHQSQNIVNINEIKKESPTVVKAAKENSVIKTISTTPEDKISLMVKDVLSNTSTLRDSRSTQIETDSKKTSKTKYLNFETIILDQPTINDVTDKLSDKNSRGNNTEMLTSTDHQPVNTTIVEDKIKATKKTDAPKKGTDKNFKTKPNNSNNCNQPLPIKKNNPRPRREAQKTNHVDYSPAVDVNSQGFIGHPADTE